MNLHAGFILSYVLFIAALSFVSTTGGCLDDYHGCADGAACAGDHDGGTIGMPPCLARPCSCAINGNCVHAYERCRDDQDCVNYLKCTVTGEYGCAGNYDGYQVYDAWYQCGAPSCHERLASAAEFESCFCMGTQ